MVYPRQRFPPTKAKNFKSTKREWQVLPSVKAENQAHQMEEDIVVEEAEKEEPYHEGSSVLC